MSELNSQGLDSAAIGGVDETSAPFLGQWNRLVSTTNWEKGRIIHEWRQALVAAAAPASEHADEAWSLRVGSVTGQHVGRLRRVYERFDALRGALTFAVVFLAAIRSSSATYPGRRFRGSKAITTSRAAEQARLLRSNPPCRPRRFE